MRYAELAVRYAKALYETTSDNARRELIAEELRALQAAFAKDPEGFTVLTSPLLSAEDRERIVSALLQKVQMSEEIRGLLLILARKGRIAIFDSLVAAYQGCADTEHGVVRGTVRSAVVLSPEERKKIEQKVSEVTSKQAILAYREDPTVIGGLIAEVGSFTFDDTLRSHLKRLEDYLNRSTH